MTEGAAGCGGSVPGGHSPLMPVRDRSGAGRDPYSPTRPASDTISYMFHPVFTATRS